MSKIYLRSSTKLFYSFKEKGLLNKSSTSHVNATLWKEYWSELKSFKYFNDSSINLLEEEVNFAYYNNLYNLLIDKHSQSLIKFRPKQEQEKYFFDYYMMVVLPLSSHIRLRNRKYNINLQTSRFFNINLWSIETDFVWKIFTK